MRRVRRARARGLTQCLHSMLENKEWKEAHNAEVRLEDMSPVAFKHLLEHLYCGDSSFTTTNLDLALDILHAADRFLVDGMKDKVQCAHGV